ncbi:MAG: DNA (cytosine-5-)-methyltransferase [Propionibacteriaceae bacterium]|jgi:DNA (cytosine-5)-methyltransferase 1|nr:DNA (cytosine-5-)-methyltransferase [Propionibacteriaceae bacterium]
MTPPPTPFAGAAQPGGHPAGGGKLRLRSLFSGAGGLDLAVEEVFDAQTVWFSETDPAATSIYQAHWPDPPNLGDITTIDWHTVPPVDVLAGGFPCQSVSEAGLRHGLKPGTRTGLWNHMARAVRALHPRWVVAENVGGLLSAPAEMERNPDHDQHPEPNPGAGSDWGVRLLGPGERVVADRAAGSVRAMGAVVSTLAALGYDTAWASIPACWAGACHRRLRVFILAWPAAANPIGV